MSWHSVSRHPAPRAWIVRAALNTRVSWWRRRRREVALDRGHEIADTTASDPGLDSALLAALRRFPPRPPEGIPVPGFPDPDTKTPPAGPWHAPRAVPPAFSPPT